MQLACLVNEVILRLVGRVAASVLARHVHVQMATVGVPAVADGSEYLAALDPLPLDHVHIPQVVIPGVVAVGVVLESDKVTRSTVATRALDVRITRVADFFHSATRDRND